MGVAVAEATKVIFDDEELKKYLSKMHDDIKNISPILKLAYMTYGFQDIMEHFENESSPSGAWVPWSKSYSDFMNRIGKGGNKLLQDNGDLRKSLLGTEKGKHVVKHDQYSVAIFSDIKYSRAHDMGYKKIPQRQFMWFSNKAMDMMAGLVLDRLIKQEGK